MNLKNDFLRIFSTLTFLVMLNIGIAQTNYTIEYKLENGNRVRATYRDLAWGVEDENGNQLVPNEYGNIYIMYAPQSFLYSVTYGFRKVNAITDKTDKPILPYFWLLKEGSYGLYSVNDDYFIPSVYDEITLVYGHEDRYVPGDGLGDFMYYGFRTKYYGFCGFYDISGNMVLPVMNQIDNVMVGKDANGKVYYVLQNGCFQGITNDKGEILIPPHEYSAVCPMPDGSFIVKKDGKAGVCDSTGKLQYMTKYTYIESNVISRDGCYYTYIGNAQGKAGGFASFDNEGKIKKDGTIVKEPTINPKDLKQKSDISIKDYFIECDESGLYGVFHKNKWLIPCQYEFIKVFPTTKYFLVGKDGYQGVINSKGKVLIPLGEYHIIRHETTMHFDINKDLLEDECWVAFSYEKQGLLDVQGNVIVSADRFTYVDKNLDELGNRLVKYGKYAGLIDKNGATIIPTNRYTSISLVLNEDCYYVHSNGKVGLCDNKGKEIIPPLYTGIDYEKHNYIKVSDGNKKGLYDPNGKLVLPAVFTKIEMKNGKITAWDNDDKFEIDADQNIINDAQNNREYEMCVYHGDNALYKENYAEAITNYKKALEYKTSEYVYYNLGVTYYNWGKYDDAITWFETCINNNPSQTTADYARDRIIEAKRALKEEQSENRKQQAYAIVGGVLGFASTMLQIANNVSYSNPMGYNPNDPMVNYNSPVDMNQMLNPYVVWNQAVQEVQQQQDFINFTAQQTWNQAVEQVERERQELYNNIKNSRKWDGSEYTETEILEIMNNIYAERMGNQSNSNGDYGFDSGVGSEYKGELTPEQYEDLYRRFEKSVQGFFDGLTINGYKTEDKQGNIKGTTVGQMPTYAYLKSKTELRDAQKEMKRIREEAAQYGVIIQQSKWETAVAGY